MKLKLAIDTDLNHLDDRVHDTLVEAVSEALATVWKGRFPVAIEGELRLETGTWVGSFKLVLTA